MVQLLLGFVSVFLDDAIDNVARSPGDWAEEESFFGKATLRFCDGSGDGGAITWICGDAIGGEIVLGGDGVKFFWVSGLEAIGAAEDKSARRKLFVRHGSSPVVGVGAAKCSDGELNEPICFSWFVVDEPS